jgi:hypothetical protein
MNVLPERSTATEGEIYGWQKGAPRKTRSTPCGWASASSIRSSALQRFERVLKTCTWPRNSKQRPLLNKKKMARRAARCSAACRWTSIPGPRGLPSSRPKKQCGDRPGALFKSELIIMTNPPPRLSTHEIENLFESCAS